MDVVIGLLVLFIIAWFVFIRSSSGKSARDEKSREASASLLAALEKNYEAAGMILGVSEQDSPIRLLKNEILVLPPIVTAFGEEKSHGRYGGASIRVARGVRISGGRVDSIPTVKPIDEGDLILTNQRVVFVGKMRTLETRLNQLDGFEYDDGRLLIRKSGRTKVMYFGLPTGAAALFGRVMELLLAHDDWEVMDTGVTRYLVHGQAPDLLAQDDRAFAAALAALMVLVMNADGVISDEEINNAIRIISAWDGGSDALQQALSGSGLSVQEAINHLRGLSDDIRQGVVELCANVADADGRSHEEQEALDLIFNAIGVSGDVSRL